MNQVDRRQLLEISVAARQAAATSSGNPVLLRASCHQGHNIMGST